MIPKEFRSLFESLTTYQKLLLVPGFFLLGIPVLLYSTDLGIRRFQHYTTVMDVAGRQRKLIAEHYQYLYQRPTSTPESLEDVHRLYVQTLDGMEEGGSVVVDRRARKTRTIPRAPTPKIKHRLRTQRKLMERWMERFREMTAHPLGSPSYEDKRRALIAMESKLERGADQVVKRYSDYYQSRIQNIRWWLVGLGTVALLIGFGISTGITKYITKQVAFLETGAQSVKQGQLDHRIRINSPDEFGQLADAFNEMAEQVEEQQAYLSGLFHSMNEALLVLSPDGVIQDTNPAATLLLGRSGEELTGSELQSVAPDLWDEGSNSFLEELREQPIQSRETNLVTGDGRKVQVLFSSSPLRKSNRRLRSIVCMLTNIADRKQLEDELRVFKRALEVCANGVVITDTNGTIEFVNPAFERISGYDEDELLGRNPRLLKIDEHDPDFYEQMWGTIRRGEIWKGEHQNLAKDGERYWVQQNIAPIRNQQGEIEKFVGVQTDITQLKKVQHKLEEALQERKTLQNELHHRVKNNLQVIVSLLRMQIRSTDRTHTTSALRDAQNRIMSMALIHEQLYAEDTLSQVKFSDYLGDLLAELQKTYSSCNERVKLVWSVDDLHLDLDTAIPIGLIVNELVSNAFQHAYRPDQEGRVEVTFHREEDEYVLMVKDDGRGLDEALNLEELDSLGLDLVRRLGEQQLKGCLSHRSGKGTEFVLTFPVHSETQGNSPANTAR